MDHSIRLRTAEDGPAFAHGNFVTELMFPTDPRWAPMRERTRDGTTPQQMESDNGDR